MPLVRVSIPQSRGSECGAIGESIHRAMLDTINVPPDDRFQIFTEHPPEGLVYDSGYLGIPRTAGFIAIQITLNMGRTLDQKRALYGKIAANLAEKPGIRPEDVLINLVEVPKENWSFGKGEASYAK
ncbi:MAG: tautomerase family protein [Acidobacteriota bacterium]|nr:tautomerase family protein [Acidobacteriota bacterium]